MNKEISQQVLDKVKLLCNETRSNFLEVAALLYQIKNENMWEGFYSSFNEFVDDCQISRSFASKLMKVHEAFVVHNGVSATKLIAVGYEKLYAVIPLLKQGKSVFEIIDMADTYSQSELREVIKACEHEPDTAVLIHPCKHCGRLMRSKV